MVKSALVTGMGGYTGRHVVKNLLDRDLEVKALDIRFESVDKRTEYVSINLFSSDADIYEQMGRSDVILYMAWHDSLKHNSLAHLDDPTKHYHLIENPYASGFKQLAVMGTVHEVGYWEDLIDENSPCAPASLYGIAKNTPRETAMLSAQFHRAILQWIYAYYTVDDSEFGNSTFSKLLSAAEEGKTSFPFTNDKNFYDLAPVDNLSDQIVVILDQDEVVGIVNAYIDQPMSLAEYVEDYIKDNASGIFLEYEAFPDRPYDSPGVWGDAMKTRQILKVDHRLLGRE